MKTQLTFLTLGLMFAVQAHAQSASGSPLYEKRLGVIKGTSQGVVLYGGDGSPAAPASAASAAPTGASAPAAQAQTPGGGLGKALGWNAPPTGQSLSSAKKLDSPNVGIPLPSAATAASQASAPK